LAAKQGARDTLAGYVAVNGLISFCKKWDLGKKTEDPME
jgi:hypothetical protein